MSERELNEIERDYLEMCQVLQDVADRHGIGARGKKLDESIVRLLDGTGAERDRLKAEVEVLRRDYNRATDVIVQRGQSRDAALKRAEAAELQNEVYRKALEEIRDYGSGAVLTPDAIVANRALLDVMRQSSVPRSESVAGAMREVVAAVRELETYPTERLVAAMVVLDAAENRKGEA